MSDTPRPAPRNGFAGWVRLRNPLARIELAASRLEREICSPGARSLVVSIRAAVAELDHQINTEVPMESGGGARAPLSEILRGLEGRLRTSFRARGVELAAEAPRDTDFTPPVWRARRGALALLRVAARCEPRALVIRGLRHEGSSRWGIEVAWKGGVHPGDACADLVEAAEAAGAVDAESGGVVEVRPEAVRIWFDGEVSP